MSSQIHSTSERSRTNWTAAMEHYFVDLMLDQMHRGNRLGHTFNKQAWVDMQVMFNSKFGCQYDKDVLKSHYTSLWKRFNDIKNLLDHNGFSWDDTQQMVVADHHVWDGYIKAHPDAQLYKDKVLMNFNDLCLIYAYTAADGRYSLSSHDIDFDDDNQGTNTGIGNGNLTMASHERTKYDWTPTMDNYFIEVMLDELKKGNDIGNAFHKEAWKDMLTKFNENFSSQYGKSFLRNRHKKLFKYYSDITSLLDQKGFTWDGKQQAIMASDDDWDNYLKTHPDARSYRQKTLLNYNDLCLIYGNATTNGNYSRILHDQNFKDDPLLITFVGEKEVDSFAGPDHRRTCWTGIMDHYLVDLLYHQVLGGNKIGLTFTSQAWIVIVSHFNANFGCCYDRDVLNSRYKHMRRQYNDIKGLLEINGFYWDDTRQMVIGEDYLWDCYLKAHCDAQSYRNTSMPSYHKLCVIYGQESSNERDSPLACNLDVDSEGPDSMIDGEDIMCHANSGTDWTPSMDRYLIDLLLKHARKGTKIDHNSDDLVWIDIMVSFRERFGLKHDKDVLKSRHKSLGMQYYDMKNLIDRKGFSWDEMQQMVTAYDHVWNAYIEECPDVKSYRAKTKPNFNDLCLIFGNSTCNENHDQIFSIGEDANHNNGHLKMDWTPPMDRYFIDLMLQQVREGSLVDHKVNKLAWVDMAMQFNAKFPLEYGRDALKSRFRSLKKLFNNMKILCETGFAWDEMQLRVVADDDLWDAYIKDYPEAQWFRNRSLPNYNDLFLIYGNANTSGRSNASSHYEDAANNVLEVNIGEEEDQILAADDPKRIHWTKQMERYFIDLMLELVQRGNNFGHGFDEQAWHWMVTIFNEKFGALCDKVVLENQFLRLMEEYDSITSLLNQEGFVWDDTKQLITARDDIWEAYTKGHPNAIRYRGRTMDAYFDLCIIYGNVFPNGRSTGSAGVKPEILDNFDERGTDKVYENAQEGETKAYNQSKKRKQATSVYSRGDLRSNKGGASNSNSRPGAVPRMGVQEENIDFSSVECVVDALQTVPQMDGGLFLEACKLLEDEKKAKLFVTMDISARRKWLLKKLRSCH